MSEKKPLEGCLLLSDIDGTLRSYESDGYPKKNIDAIKEFEEKGGLFALATGRSVVSTRKVVGECFKTSCPSIIYNGGALYDYDKDEVLWSVYLPDEARKHIYEINELFPGVGVEIHIDRELYCVRESERSRQHILRERDKFEVFPLDERFLSRKWNKVLLTGFEEEIDKVKEYCEAIDVTDKDYYFIRSESCLYEILPLEASKGKALRRLAKMMNIKPENVFAIGDYYNDAELLKSAGFSATVPGAPDDIKELADYVTCSCEQGAVADFIKFIENKMGV